MKLIWSRKDLWKIICHFQVWPYYCFRFFSCKKLIQYFNLSQFCSQVLIYWFLFPTPDCGPVNTYQVCFRYSVPFCKLFNTGVVRIICFVLAPKIVGQKRQRQISRKFSLKITFGAMKKIRSFTVEQKMQILREALPCSRVTLLYLWHALRLRPVQNSLP